MHDVRKKLISALVILVSLLLTSVVSLLVELYFNTFKSGVGWPLAFYSPGFVFLSSSTFSLINLIINILIFIGALSLATKSSKQFGRSRWVNYVLIILGGLFVSTLIQIW